MSYFAQSEDGDITRAGAYGYATGIVICTAFMTLIFHPFTLYMNKIACNVRVGCSGLMYQKTLRLSKSATEDGQNGKIINMLSNDLAKFELGLQLVHDVWRGPLEALAFLIVIYTEIGVSAVVGMALLAGFIPLQGDFFETVKYSCQFPEPFISIENSMIQMILFKFQHGLAKDPRNFD